MLSHGLRPDDTGVLRRLTGDDRECATQHGTRLARIARTDEDYVSFVLAAWWARDDYSEWRERTRQAVSWRGRSPKRRANWPDCCAKSNRPILAPHEFTSLQALLWRSPSAQGGPSTPYGAGSGKKFAAQLGSTRIDPADDPTDLNRQAVDIEEQNERHWLARLGEMTS